MAKSKTTGKVPSKGKPKASKAKKVAIGGGGADMKGRKSVTGGTYG